MAVTPLACPITVLGGHKDPRVTQADLAAWASHTQREFRLRLFAGNHFLQRSAEAELPQALTEEIARYLAQGNQ